MRRKQELNDQRVQHGDILSQPSMDACIFTERKPQVTKPTPTLMLLQGFRQRISKKHQFKARNSENTSE